MGNPEKMESDSGEETPEQKKMSEELRKMAENENTTVIYPKQTRRPDSDVIDLNMTEEERKKMEEEMEKNNPIPN